VIRECCRRILHSVSIALGEGEIVTVIGPNGAGKSTLMRAIFGLVDIRSGDVTLRGEAINGLRASALVSRGMAFVPQVDNVFPSLAVRENLEMGWLGPRAGLEPARIRIIALFPQLGQRLDAKARSLSGGERQMQAIARALIAGPRALFLDEPPASHSPIMAENVFAKIVEIGQSGVASLLVEQNARATLDISDRGYVLIAGQTRLEGSGEALLGDPEIAQHYLGPVRNQ
jgi:ABC-type branched-subunit amino acid transport system ATPase component